MLAVRQVCSLPRKVLNVTLVFRSTEPALDVKHWMFRKYYHDKLKDLTSRQCPGKIRAITPKGVSLTNKEGERGFSGSREYSISYRLYT